MTTTMDGNRDCALLALWEHGQALSAIDRALMLCAWARPELDREQLSRLPLGAVNAALLAASVLALSDPALAARLDAWRAAQTGAVAEIPQDDG